MIWTKWRKKEGKGFYIFQNDKADQKSFGPDVYCSFKSYDLSVGQNKRDLSMLWAYLDDCNLVQEEFICVAQYRNLLKAI